MLLDDVQEARVQILLGNTKFGFYNNDLNEFIIMKVVQTRIIIQKLSKKSIHELKFLEPKTQILDY